MNRNRRILILILAFMVAFTGMFPAAAFAEKKKEDNSKKTEQTADKTENKGTDASKKEGEAKNTDGSNGAANDAAKKEENKKPAPPPDDIVAEGVGVTPVLTAAGAALYCDNTGETVFSKNIDRSYDPYHLSKLMVALLAIKNLPLDEKIKVTGAALEQPEPKLGLVKGEKLTVEQLLHACLLGSYNDVAYVLARRVKKNPSKFIKLMNKTAENIGCENTTFTSYSGAANRGNKTTVRDMIQLTRVAFSDPTIQKITSKKKYTIKKTNKHDSRVLQNPVDLVIAEDSGVFACKAGTLDATKSPVIVGYRKNGLKLYLVLLNETKAASVVDLKRLIQYAVDSVKGVRVVKKGKAMGTVRIRHGARTQLEAYSAEDGYAYLPKEGSESLISTNVTLNSDVTAPVDKGEVVGSLKIYAGSDLVNEIPLVVQESVEVGWFPSYVGISNRTTVIILVVIGVLLLIYIILLIMRFRAKRRKQKLRQLKIQRMAEQEAAKEAEYEARNWKI